MGVDLLEVHSLILEKRQGFAVLSRHAVDGQSAGKLECHDACFAGLRANANGGRRLQGIVGENRGFQGVMKGLEGNDVGWKFSHAARGPGIVKSPGSGFYSLAKQKLFVAPPIHDDVERTSGCAVEARVESGPKVR